MEEGIERKSLPARGAWIEISALRGWLYRASVSLPARGAWIEIPYDLIPSGRPRRSLPARGAWIEIEEERVNVEPEKVAPRTGSVD